MLGGSRVRAGEEKARLSVHRHGLGRWGQDAVGGATPGSWRAGRPQDVGATPGHWSRKRGDPRALVTHSRVAGSSVDLPPVVRTR